MTVAQPRKALTEQPDDSDERMARLLTLAVCNTYAITTTVLFGRRRTAAMTDARRMLAYVLMHDVGLTCNSAGRIMGRHHATILHHRDCMRALLADRDQRVMLAMVRRSFAALNRGDAAIDEGALRFQLTLWRTSRVWLDWADNEVSRRIEG